MDKAGLAKKLSYERLLKAATIASVSVATLLVVLKLSIWGVSGSVSVLASSMDSILDMAASLISFFAVRIALKPADEDHHFGHGKAEQLAALAQASFIAGSALYLMFYAIGDLRSGGELKRPDIAIYAMVLSTVITCILVLFQRYVVAKTNSVAICADAAHYRMDIMVNIGVLIALVLSQYGWDQADPVVSIIISLIMLFSVKGLGWNAIELLMDKALPKSQLSAIRQIISQEPGVEGVHQLRTRQSGNQPVIQFHLDMKGDLPLSKAHEIGDRVKKKLLDLMPDADIISHIDPH